MSKEIVISSRDRINVAGRVPMCVPTVAVTEKGYTPCGMVLARVPDKSPEVGLIVSP